LDDADDNRNRVTGKLPFSSHTHKKKITIKTPDDG
jgi:hypothetical protein